MSAVDATPQDDPLAGRLTRTELPRTPHDALDVGPDTGRMLSTYLVEAGQPLTTLCDAPD